MYTYDCYSIFGDYPQGDILVTTPPIHGLDEFPRYPPGYLVPLPARQIQVFPLGKFRNEYDQDCQIDINPEFYGNDVHMYELTLTQPDTVPKDPYDLISAFRKIVQSKMHQVIDYMYVIELTKSGVPHLHALLVTKCYVNKSKIKYPYRFTLSTVRKLSAWINYLLKENFSADIIYYCQSKGIQEYECYESDMPQNEETM